MELCCPYQLRAETAVTFRDLREARVGIFTFGVKLGVAPYNPAQDLVDVT